MERKIVYFEKPRPSNTDETLRLAAEQAADRGIDKIILASTKGDTAQRAAAKFAGAGVKLIIVPHQFGFTETQLFSQELVSELE